MAQLGQTISLYQNLTSQNTNIQPVAFTSSYSDLINTPVISAVGHTGQYSDVLNAPTRASQFANDANYAVKGEPVSEFANDAQYTINGSKISQFTNDKSYTVNGSNVSQFANDAQYTVNGSKVSQFTNDKNYTVAGGNVSQFANDAQYTVNGSKVSQFTNDAAYTVAGSKVSQFTNDSNYTVNGSKVSQFTNDSNYAVSGTRVSQFSNDVPYATQAQVNQAVADSSASAPNWVNMTLLNGWAANYSGTAQAPRYYVDKATGRVFLSGGAYTSNNNALAIANLGSSLATFNTKLFPTVSNATGQCSAITVDSSGNIKAAGSSQVTFNGVSWYPGE